MTRGFFFFLWHNSFENIKRFIVTFKTHPDLGLSTMNNNVQTIFLKGLTLNTLKIGPEF